MSRKTRFKKNRGGDNNLKYNDIEKNYMTRIIESPNVLVIFGCNILKYTINNL